MSTVTIQRQYDELIAKNYDLDPQDLAGISLDHALQQLEIEGPLTGTSAEALQVLDVGMGTGLFFEKLAGQTNREFRPYGLDLSQRMLDFAHQRLPDLESVVDDAANLDQHFTSSFFDIVCSHFITGFVPLSELAPKIWDKLKPGGYWSFVGATSKAYPTLQKKASSKIVQMMMGNRRVEMADLITPADQEAVSEVFENCGFEIDTIDTLEPELKFRNFDEFMKFAYDGGWLTPFIEDLELQKAHPALRVLLNTFVFPIHDHHTIVVGLARKPLA